jgi:CheY-like chemotaxis protein
MLEDNATYGAMVYEDLLRIGQTSWINSESEFYALWDAIATEPPDIFVVDVMLAWSHPGLEYEQVKRPEEKDLYTAGIRCAEKIRESKNEQLKRVPIVFYTVVPQPDVESRIRKLAQITYIQKPSDVSMAVDEVLRVTRDATRVSY